MKISISFSGKEHEGARLSVHEEDERILDLSSEDFIHAEKKRNKKLNREEPIPRQDSQHGETLDMHVSKENWLGRRERDPARKRSRLDLHRGNTFNGGFPKI